MVAAIACTPKNEAVNKDALVDSLNAACDAVWKSGDAETGLYSFDWVADDQTVYPNRVSYMMYWKKTPENKWMPVMQINHQANVDVK